MIYYVFNNNKPLIPKKDIPNLIVVHYCPHCNTELVGEWSLKNHLELKNSQKKKEVLAFTHLKNCTICGKEFDDNFEHHFCNRVISNDKYDGFELDLVPLSSGYSINDGIYCVKNRSLTYYKEFRNFPTSLPASICLPLGHGDTVVTKIGQGVVDFNVQNERIAVDYHDDRTSLSVLSFLEYFRTKERNQITDSKLDEFVNKCISDSQSSSIKSVPFKEKFDLKRYLEQLLLIEKNIFSISKRLRELYFLNYKTEKEALASEKLLLLKDKNSVDKALENYKALKSKKIEKTITLEDFPIQYPAEPIKPQKPNEPVLAKPGFFNKKRALAENALLTEKYEKDLEKYNLDNEKYKAALKKRKETIAFLETEREKEYKSAIENAKESLEKEVVAAKENYENLLKEYKELEVSAADRPTPQKAEHRLLIEEITTAEELLKSFYKAQNDMYSYGVIFEKYRNFVAISSFCEYISSGRCETLEGANGAYNLYENEIRMNMVIGQLNQVIESLEEIKQNQYMIYSAIQESNRQLNALNSSTSRMVSTLGEIKSRAVNMESYMSRIADNTEVIAYNTERTAFYAKKNAELTNALGFMVALK